MREREPAVVTAPDAAATIPDPSRPLAAGTPSGTGDAEAELAAGATVGRFVILRTLGAGGAGVVYAAYDPELDRTVALKLLRAQVARHHNSQKRFLREAQALAKLSHPNVIAVYDITAQGERTIIAMEYIDGVTFREWMARGQRSWREIVAVLAKAGRGVAAAHAAGLVHRDFKPDNVLVSKDGRVVVTDFGLARAADPDAPVEASPGERFGAVLAGPLTATGPILGTPHYMAPEQWLGHGATPRTDQFSFCLTLCEALLGRRANGDVAPTEPKWDGFIRDLIEPARLPRWLEKVLLRGLSREPEARFPAMDALLAALASGPRRRKRRFRLAAGAAVAVAAVSAATIYGLHGSAPAEVCHSAGDRIASDWNPATEHEIEAAFVATGVPYAAATWRSVQPILDGYAGALSATATQACTATRVKHTLSEHLMDLQMACVDSRRRELSALIQIFREPNATTIEHAVAAAGALTSVDNCTNLEALARKIAPPSDLVSQSRVDAVRATLIDAKAQADAGNYRRAVAMAADAAATARTIEYLPIAGEALYRLGAIQLDMGNWPAARKSLDDAIWNAEASGDDATAALALVDQVATLTELTQFERAERVARRADAVGRRSHALPQFRAGLLSHRGELHLRQGHFDQALADYQASLAITRRVFGDHHAITAGTLYNLGLVARERGKTDAALAHFREALAIEDDVFGGRHPQIALTRSAIGQILDRRGQYDEALAEYHKARAILEPLGETSLLASLLTNIGNLYRHQGNAQAAEKNLRHALAIYKATAGEMSPKVAQTLANLANVLVGQGDYDTAIADYKKSITIQEKALGKDHPLLARAVGNLCLAYYFQERYDEAAVHCERALAIQEHALGPEHPAVGVALINLGEVYRSQGNAPKAVALLARGLAIQKSTGAPAAKIAATEDSLAQARRAARH